MPPKSIFRQPDSKHFQLVHRSQRDPLINDPEASQHVLKAIPRKKGKSRADLETHLAPDELAHDEDTNVGEAAQYGVYYDDTEYNYMQHLRQVGENEDSVLIEAPVKKSSDKIPVKQKGKVQIQLRDNDSLVVPPEALPSTSELPKSYAYESQQAIPSSIAGFQPNMDPHLRQVLEALEDDAFVDDDLEDDFFGELVNEGERNSDEEFGFEFSEQGILEQEQEIEESAAVEQDENWEARFAKFKKQQKDVVGSMSGLNDFASEGGDTVGRLPEMSVIGGKRRRKGTSDASGYSMSSSSMFRNPALQTLDERFDQIILKEYNEEEENDDDDFPKDSFSIHSDEDSDDAPELITTREDFESMMDDFLDNYEILGRKMKHKLEGENPIEKLDTLRRAMGEDERVRIMWDGESKNEDDDDIMSQFEKRNEKDRWDCETILSTYSNLENHPRVIRARNPRPVPKITLDPKTGMPIVEPNAAPVQSKRYKGNKIVEPALEAGSDDEDDNSTEDGRSYRTTITRPRAESPTAKKARKDAVKAERAARRVDKKANKEQYSIELKHQMKGVINKELKGKVRKL